MHCVLKRNFEVFAVLDWLTAVTAHIPNAGEDVVRYYGWYSNVSRRKRRKAQREGSGTAPATMIKVPPPASSRPLKQGWARPIKQVYETDPLLRPSAAARCGSLPSFIDQAAVMTKQEFPLGRNLLRPGQCLGNPEQAGGGREIQLLPEQVQVVEAIGSGDDAGIRDGIRRSRQEVGQPHRSPQRRRQDDQGQVE